MGKNHDKKVEIMRKYLSKIADGFSSYYVAGEIPSKKIDNALKNFAFGMDKTTIIGFYDTTVMGSGKKGYIFTDDKICYSDIMEKPQKIWYDDIKSMKIINSIFPPVNQV